MTVKITLQKKKEQINKETKEKTIVAEEKDYSIPFVPTSSYFEYLLLEAEKEKPDQLLVDDVKKIVPLIVKTYENQFTEEEFYEGVPGYLIGQVVEDFIKSLNKNPYPSKPEGQTGNLGKKAD